MAGIELLTNATPNQASSRLFTTPVPSTNGLKIGFDFYAYGGTGADGISFFFVDGNQVLPRAGGFGGSLGYAQRLNEAGVLEPGVPGGYLGIGFDEFGNFSNATEGRVGGRRFTPDAIAVRGSEATQYRYLTGTGTLPFSLDNPDPNATRDSSRRTAEIMLSPTGLLTVQVDLNGNGTFTDPGELAINQFDVQTANGLPLPSSFKFGFAASTGDRTNIHEVGNFTITTFDGTPIAGVLTGDRVVIGGDGNDPIVGDVGNDELIGGTGNDTLTGGAGNDKVIGGIGADQQTGDAGADTFIFSGTSKALALRTSTVRSLDRITDFRFREGDKFQLDFDNNLTTSQRPKRLYNVGRVGGRNLQAAIKTAYADKLTRRKGNQALRADEAVFFRFGNRTFLSVNDGRAPFAPNNDLVADVSGIQFKPGDARPAALRVNSYFI